MVILSEIMAEDPTLLAADKVLEEKVELPRPYLGMSQIGESCQRKSWYRFRFALKEKFDAKTLKRFEDGHRTEKLIIDRLKLVDGLDIIDMVGGKQIGFSDCDGHFKGHADGEAIGLLQAPKTPHILEIKCVSDKKLTELKGAKTNVGEKLALRKWNETYYYQAQLYMHYRGYERHWMVIASPGGRDWDSVRTDYNAQDALRIIDRAKRIIKSDKPLDKVGNESYWECRYCSFSGVCHKNEMPDRGCRTCIHACPIENGGWRCERFGKVLDFETQLEGCPAHLFLPSLVPGEIIEASEEKGFIRYKMQDGTEWVDSEGNA